MYVPLSPAVGFSSCSRTLYWPTAAPVTCGWSSFSVAPGSVPIDEHSS